MSGPAVETRDLTRRFGDRLAVDRVSMTVPAGSIYGFLGRNGAGKTTTLRMLLGLLRPSAGSASIMGIDVAKDRGRAMTQVGALLDSHGFYGNLSGRENLDLARRLRGFPHREIDRVLEVVEMQPHAGLLVSAYSLGMRQRLGIARAMLGAPPLLILDEPTNGLDPEGIADLRVFLRALPERAGATVLVSSHLLHEIERTASHIGVLRDGRLVVEGELTALKSGLATTIVFDTDDDIRASAIASARGLQVVEGSEGLIITIDRHQDDRVIAAALNAALVEAGLAVRSIGRREPSLEGVYWQREKTELSSGATEAA